MLGSANTPGPGGLPSANHSVLEQSLQSHPRSAEIWMGHLFHEGMEGFVTATGLASSWCQALNSLSLESDPEIFFSDLLSLGRQAMDQGATPLSLRIFAHLIHDTNRGFWRVPPAIRRQAQDLRGAMSGSGPLGARLEFLSGQFIDEVFHPATLAGMGLASTVGLFAKAHYLRSMAGRPMSWITRLASRAPGVMAELRALPWEVSAFWAAHRGVETYLHPERISWAGRDMVREWVSLGLGLGFLKMGSWVGGAVAPAHRLLGQTGGTYAGILSGHAFQERVFGDHVFSRTGSAALDGLILLAQFHLSGRVAQTLMGPAHGFRMANLAGEISRLESGPWFSASLRHGIRSLFIPQKSWAFAGIPAAARPVANSIPSQPHIMMMSGNAGEGSGNRPGVGQGRPFSASSRPLPPKPSMANPIVIQRLNLERRIQAVFPGYVEQLGKLLSETRSHELLNKPPEENGQSVMRTHPEMATQIREHWGETGVPRLTLQDPMVQEAVGQVWINPRSKSDRPGPVVTAALGQISSAQEWLGRYVFPDGTRYQGSSLKYSQELSVPLERDIFVFSDLARQTGSFKERGALVEVFRAAQAGVTHAVTASHGNHGLAVALAAQKLNLRSTIVVPHTTPKIKIEQLHRLGATVVTTGKQPERGYEEARDWGLQYVLERNEFLRHRLDLDFDPLRYIHGFEQVIPGQGVAGWEMIRSIDRLPHHQRQSFQKGRPVFLIPLGGGGLAAGAGAVLRQEFPNSLILGVLSEQAPAMHVSLMQGRRFEVLVNPKSLFDSGIGLAVPGARPFEILREVLDGTVPVSDAYGGESIRWIHRHMGQTVEGGGAAGVAAILSGRLEAFGVGPQDPIVTLFSGRNIDANRLQGILSGQEARLPGGILDASVATTPADH